jgi:hypothetical protein
MLASHEADKLDFFSGERSLEFFYAKNPQNHQKRGNNG